MSFQKTKIEYLTHTWNPITMRCTPVSEGCKNCWHLRYRDRFTSLYSKGSLYIPSPTFFPSDLHIPKSKIPRRIGVQFMGDLFHESISNDMITKVFLALNNYLQDTFLILTKRPRRIIEFMSSITTHKPKFPSNIWLGVTCENQRTADERIPILLQIPAAVRWISVEPMLEKLDLTPYLGYTTQKIKGDNHVTNNGIDTLRICENGRISDPSRRNNMENEERKIDSSRTSIGKRISTIKENDQRKEVLCLGPSSGMASFQRPNSTRIDDKSQEWNQGRQQTGESRINGLFRTDNSCNEYIRETSTVKKSIGRKELYDEIEQCSSQRNSGGLCPGKNNNVSISRSIQCDLPNNIGLCEGEKTEGTRRPNSKLCSQTTEDYQTKKCQGPIHLVIVGAETGPGKRPMDTMWAVDLLAQCKEAGVPFFFKKDSEGKYDPNFPREYPK